MKKELNVIKSEMINFFVRAPYNFIALQMLTQEWNEKNKSR